MTHEEILTMLGDYVDYLIAGSTAEAPLWNIEKVRSGKPNKWNYIDGCMITACLSLYKTTGDEKFLDFSKKFLDYFVKDNGVIETYDPAEYNLDNVNQGKNLFTLYDLTGNQRYRDAIETIRGQLETQPRTKEGNFWHKKIYPNQVWLDGTYMAQPFYMEYETRYNKMQGCIDSYKQFMNIQKHMRDEKTGLYYHGYDESRQMYWADPVTGCSPNFWLRAMGWFLVAMVDVLERMDEQLYNEYRGIMAMLKQAVEDMQKKGALVADAIADVPAGYEVVIRSHGVPRTVYDELDARGITYHDATCPFVQKIQRIAAEAEKEGAVLLVAGDKTHPEVQGIVGHTRGEVFVFADLAELKAWKGSCFALRYV